MAPHLPPLPALNLYENPPIDFQPVLDSRSYPHIFERILEYSDYRTLLHLRVLSTELLIFICRLLSRHVAVFVDGEAESYKAITPCPLSYGYREYSRSAAHRKRVWGLPFYSHAGYEWYYNPRLVRIVNTIDFYHCQTLNTERQKHLWKVPELAERLPNLKVVRHRFNEEYKTRVLPFRARTHIYFVNLYPVWSRGLLRSPIHIKIPSHSKACTTAILHCRFDTGIRFATDVSLEWQINDNVVHVVIIGAGVENGPPSVRDSSLGCPVQHGIVMRSQLAALVKTAMMKQALRLTMVDIGNWVDMDRKPPKYEAIYPLKSDIDIKRCFLTRFDHVHPEWPNTATKNRVLENVRFLSMDQWSAEVGENVFHLATVE